jgi:competence protein ComEC
VKKAPFVILFLFLSSGILLGNICDMNIFLGLFIVLFLVTLYSFQEHFFSSPISSKIKSASLLLAILFIGLFRFSLDSKNHSESLLSKKYLKGDVFLGKIDAIKHGKGQFSKTEFSVKKLIRFQDTIQFSEKIVLFVKNPEQDLKRKDVLLVSTIISKIRNKGNIGEFDAEFYFKNKGIENIAFADEGSFFKLGTDEGNLNDNFLDLRDYFSSILSQHLKGDELAIAKALILGDKSSLDGEITSKFSNTGAMHVLAVSGLHVGILVQILTMFFSLFSKFISKKNGIIISLLIIWIYALMTGFSPSVVRSTIMFTMLVGSTLLNRNYSNFNVLAFSAVIILMWNPKFLFDIGFQLSFLAMLGIFMFYKPLSKLIYMKNKILRMAYEGTMVGLAAQTMTVPLSLYYFHQFPNYFMLTNLGLMLFSFLILAFGIALFAFKMIPLLNYFLAFSLSLSIYATLFIINYIDGLPGSVAAGFNPNLSLVILLFVGILLLFYTIKRENLKLLRGNLFVLGILATIIIFNRYQNLESSKIYFFQANKPLFIIKNKSQNLVFYADKLSNPKKAEFDAISFSKVFPGELIYTEISQKKETIVNSKDLKIKVIRVKGGYEIGVNEKKYIYVSSFTNTSEGGVKILASHLSLENSKFQLKKGGINFEI